MKKIVYSFNPNRKNLGQRDDASIQIEKILELKEYS
jgi:hypothetical protein